MIRLPPGEMIKDTEVRLQALGQAKGGSVYPLPDFYGDGWIGLSTDELMVFHAERIGEYTINNTLSTTARSRVPTTHHRLFRRPAGQRP